MEGDRGVRVRKLLEEEVAEWLDDEAISGMFQAPNEHADDTNSIKFNFWSSLILRIAGHLETITITAEEVQFEWFMRRGLLPMGMDIVLADMLEKGRLQKLQQMLPPQRTWLAWFRSSAGAATSWTVRGFDSSDTPSQTFVVMPVLKEKSEAVTRVLLRESAGPTDLVVTSRKLCELCKGQEATALVIKHLVMERKAVHITVKDTEAVEGLKIIKNSKSEKFVTENDRRVLRLHHTAEMLEDRCNIYQRKATLANEQALMAVRAGNKQAAIRHLKQKRSVDAAIARCHALIDKVDSVLHIISETLMSQEIMAALRMGAQAVRDQGLSAEEVKASMEEMDAVVIQHQQVQTVIESGDGDELSSEELQQEFDLLEAELLPSAKAGAPSPVPRSELERKVVESVLGETSSVPCSDPSSVGLSSHDQSDVRGVAEPPTTRANNEQVEQLEAAFASSLNLNKGGRQAAKLTE